MESNKIYDFTRKFELSIFNFIIFTIPIINRMGDTGDTELKEVIIDSPKKVDNPPKDEKKNIDGVVLKVDHPEDSHQEDTRSSESTKIGSKQMRKKIIRELIQPNYFQNLESALRWKTYWYRIGICLAILSGLVKIGQDIVLYLNLVTAAQILGYCVYGTLGMSALTLRYSSKRSAYVNKIMTHLGIKDQMPGEDDDTKKTDTKTEVV